MAIEPDDLIDDRTLGRIMSGNAVRSVDTLEHSSLAAQVADIAVLSSGSVNVAIFGPWGSGKSSLVPLIKAAFELRPRRVRQKVLVFDAWRSAGDNFQVNFLSEISRTISKRKGRWTQRRLFESRRTLTLPFGLSGLPRVLRFVVLSVVILAITLALPLLYTWYHDGWIWSNQTWPEFLDHVRGWFSYAISGTVILAVIGIASDVTRASIEETAPNEVTQFRDLFDRLLKGRQRYVIFIDELDRCAPPTVVEILSGLRTFLDHKNCTFVVAFDRAAVVGAIVTEVKEELPARDPSGYFASAGEYLDKIFQYQLALPPQTARSHRRMARDLTAGRGGIWGALRATYGASAEDVLALVSPIHVVSVRRTKVLLNDFAINARAFENLFGPAWTDRAYEIAVHTVICTEFPQLAQDMLIEPDLPRYLIDRDLIPTRKSLFDLVESYRNGQEQLERIADHELESDQREALLSEQWQTLERYLQRVASMGVPFPRPDITLMSKSHLADRFDDPGLYAAVIRAADEDPEITLELLSAASPTDLGNAVAYLLDESEGLSPRESQRTAAVVGEIVARADFSLPPTQSESFRALWRRAASVTNGPIWLTSEALTGFMSELAAHETPDVIRTAISDAHDIDISIDRCLMVAIQSMPAKWVAQGLRTLEPLTLSSLTDGPDALAAFVVRSSSEASTELNRLRSDLLKLVSQPAEPELEPIQSGLPAAAATQIRQRNEELTAESQLRVASVNQAMLDGLNASWSLLRESPASVIWVGETLWRASAYVPDAAELLDELIADLSVLARQFVQLALVAQFPEELSERWDLSDLDLNLATNAGAAWASLAKCAATPTSKNRREVADTLHLLSAQELKPIVEPAVVAWLGQWAASAEVVGSPDEFGLAARGIRDGRAVDLDESTILAASISLYARVIDAGDEPTLEVALGELLAEPVTLLSTLFDTAITPGSPGTAVCRALFATNIAKSQLSRGQRAKSIPIALMREALVAPQQRLLVDWLSIGPQFRWVRDAATTASLIGVSAPTWATYSRQASEPSRVAAWQYMAENSFSDIVMTSVGSFGVSLGLYEETSARIHELSNFPSRQAALRRFLTLPQGNDNSASTALIAISKLHALGRTGDWPLVAQLALRNSAAMTAADRARTKTLLRGWFGKPSLAQVGWWRRLRSAGLA